MPKRKVEAMKEILPFVTISIETLVELNRLLVVDESDFRHDVDNPYAVVILKARQLLGLPFDSYRATGRDLPENIFDPRAIPCLTEQR